jgi:hypothetical protein
MAFDYLLATTAFYNILNGIYLQMKTMEKQCILVCPTNRLAKRNLNHKSKITS